MALSSPKKVFSSLCVFCGSSIGNDPAFAHAAETLGALLAANGTTLIYGGGNTGLMGTLAESALKHGGRVIGVMPHALAEKEVAHTSLTELRLVASMHERKATMAHLAEGFLALPGGHGTLEEFFEVLAWGQLGLHAKPFGLLNVSNYYGHLLSFVDHAIGCALIRPEYRELMLHDSDAARLLTRMAEWEPVKVEKWIKKKKP